MSNGVKSFFLSLRKKRIIEILAAFIGGGWLLIEVVERLLVSHYHFPEKTIDITVVTLIAALICTLFWRWFSGRDKPRRFKLELVLIPLVVLVTVLLDINLLLHLRSPESETIPTSKWKNSIAVLPFVNLSPEKDQEYFCDGITEELINRLSNIKELKVPARTSAFFFKGKPQDIQDIGQKLKVNTVLEGSVRRAGNELRITAQLINIANGYHLWSETYNRQLQDIFALQDEISLKIIDKLKIELLGEERARVVKRYTENTEAYDSYVRGLWLLNNKVTEEEWRKAVLHFERAIEMNPSFSLAYVELAHVQLNRWFWQYVSADEAIPKAKKALAQALKIDPELPEALAWSGLIKFNFEYDWPGGESDIKKALEIDSNCGIAHLRLRDFLLSTGQIDKAIEENSAALELDPLSLYRQVNHAWGLYIARRYDDAIKQCRKSLELDPEYPYALGTLGSCYVQKSQFSEAIAALQKATIFAENNTNSLSDLAYAYAMSGNHEKAIETVRELDKLSEHVYVSKYYVACIQAVLGDKDKAFESLESAYKERDTDLIFLKVDPKFKTDFLYYILSGYYCVAKRRAGVLMALPLAFSLIAAQTERTKQAPQVPPELAWITLVAEEVRLNPQGHWEAAMKHGIVMVYVPAGEFAMGSPRSESGRESDEGPVHRVFTKGIWIGKYEVTRALWQTVMGGAVPGPSERDLPQGNVSYRDVQAFLLALNGRSALDHRLPTEAEWEKCCRSGSPSPQYGPIDEIAWNVANSGGRSHPVGTKRPNGFGLYDMLGNVWEWCSDWYASGYYGRSPLLNPAGPSRGQRRVCRGGGFLHGGGYLRSAHRNSQEPAESRPYLGFRLVLDSPL